MKPVKERRYGHKWGFYVSIGLVLMVAYKLLENISGVAEWFSKLGAVIAPFLEAVLIAYILYVPCNNIENFILKKSKNTKRKTARYISIFISYLLFALIIGALFTFIIPIIVQSIRDLIDNIQWYYNSINNAEIEITGNDALNNIPVFIQTQILKPLVEYVKNFNWEEFITFEKMQGYISSALGIARTFANLLIAIVCSIYILAERDEMIAFMAKVTKSYTTKKRYLKLKHYFIDGSNIFFGFLSSQIIDAIIVAAIMIIALYVMKVKYAAFLGILIGLFNLIPTFGAIVAVVLTILITILTGGWKQAILVAIVATIISQIDARIINPKITGDKLKISPLLVIFSLSIGGAFFGVLGMFLAVPVATLIKVMIEDGVKDRNKAKTQEHKTRKVNYKKNYQKKLTVNRNTTKIQSKNIQKNNKSRKQRQKLDKVEETLDQLIQKSRDDVKKTENITKN